MHLFAFIHLCHHREIARKRVYTVGILDNLTSGSDTDKMMNNISSNHPNASSVSNSGGTRAEGDYFFNSPDGTAIPSIFAQIAESVATTKIVLGTETEVHNAFDTPTPANLNDKELTIEKNGLHKGESAIFEIVSASAPTGPGPTSRRRQSPADSSLFCP